MNTKPSTAFALLVYCSQTSNRLVVVQIHINIMKCNKTTTIHYFICICSFVTAIKYNIRRHTYINSY